MNSVRRGDVTNVGEVFSVCASLLPLRPRSQSCSAVTTVRRGGWCQVRCCPKLMEKQNSKFHQSQLHRHGLTFSRETTHANVICNHLDSTANAASSTSRRLNITWSLVFVVRYWFMPQHLKDSDRQVWVFLFIYFFLTKYRFCEWWIELFFRRLTAWHDKNIP